MDALLKAQNLGVDIEVDSKSYGSLLVPVILNKIPEDMRLIVSRKFDQNTWDVDGMLDAFKVELQARERCFHMRSSNREERKEELPKRQGKQWSTTSSLLTEKEYQTPFACTYCQGRHTL